MRRATKLARRELREPAFDETQPRRMRRDEVSMEPCVPLEPSSDFGRPMRPVLVHDDIGIEFVGDGLNLRLLVDAQDYRVVWRGHVEPNDIANISTKNGSLEREKPSDW